MIKLSFCLVHFDSAKSGVCPYPTNAQDGKRSLAEDFLLKEYENAARVTFHADDLRDKLSSFFLVFAGAALGAVGLLLQGTFTVELFGDKKLTAGTFLLGVSFVGLIILCIHARLRRVQLEHFGIISRIRIYCLRKDLALWNAIRLTPNTLPVVRLRNWSGSELWALTIVFPAAVLFGAGTDFIVRWLGGVGWAHLVGVATGVIASFVLWKLYTGLARAPRRLTVTATDVDAWLQKEY